MIWTLLIGLFVGVVAKFFMPGRDPGGFVMTIVLGIAGAMLANWIGGSSGMYHYGEPMSFISAVLGAMLILLVYRSVSSNSKTT